MQNSTMSSLVSSIVKHLSKPTLKFILEGTGQVVNAAMQEKLVDRYSQGNPLQLYRPGFPTPIELPKVDPFLKKKIKKLNNASVPVPASKFSPLSADIANRARRNKDIFSRLEVPDAYDIAKREKELGRHGFYV